MALTITRASDPISVTRLTLALYGDPGVGKSTLAFSASKPLLLDFDNGAHRASNRQDTVRIASWKDVDAITPADLAPYDTVIVDTAGRMLDALTVDIIAGDSKLGKGGVLSQQGWGKLKARFTAFLKMLNSSGLDVVLIAHGTEKMDGETVNARLDVQGGSKDEIYKSVDAMGRMFIRNGKRVLCFDPTESAFGKNPGQFGVLDIPTPVGDFLATVLADTKAALNKQTEAMIEEAKAIESWRDAIALLDTADKFNAQIANVKKQSRAIQKLFSEAATAKGLHFDKPSGLYAATEAQEAA